MKKTCLIGWPVSHSRSPLIHNYWLKQYGIPSCYEKHGVAPDQLQAFVQGLSTSDFIGCNVTIPHKEQVLAFVNQMDDRVKIMGAANTLYIRDGKLHATNTDGEGYLANFQHSFPHVSLAHKTIVILGAGGAAKAIIAALLSENVQQIIVINRSAEKALALQAQFGEKLTCHKPEQQNLALAQCDLLINTTSLGMTGQPALHIDLAHLKPTAIVSDIVYAPLQTPLLLEAESRGHHILGGLGMLLHQAVRGFELWYGVKPDVTPELTERIITDLLQEKQP